MNNINIYKSNNVKDLIDKLVSNINKFNNVDFFNMPIQKILIPSLKESSWLDFELEERLSILFRIEYDTLENFIFKLNTNTNRVILKEKLFFEIFSLLRNDSEFINSDEMWLVKNYLDNNSKKICQLSDKLSGIFLKYLDNKFDSQVDILEKWNNNSLNFEDNNSKDNNFEECELFLYNKLLESKEIKEIFTKSFNGELDENLEKIKLHIFNYQYISKGILSKLSEYTDVNVYYNPINEDLPVCKDDGKNKSIQKNFDLNIEGYNIEEISHKPKSVETVLDALKYRNSDKISQDKSIQILSSPGVFREVECVYNSIIRNLNENKDLKPEEIGVVLTDSNKYIPIIDSVFGIHKYKIPFNKVCSMPKEVNDYIEGINKIASVCEDSFSKKSVISLFNNPCFRHKFNVEEKKIEEFLKYVDDVNICAFFDGKSKNEYFKRPEEGQLTDQYTWNWVGSNLRIGSIMDLCDNNRWENFIPQSEYSDFKIYFNTLTKLYFELLGLENLIKEINEKFSKGIEPDISEKELLLYFKYFLEEFLDSRILNENLKGFIDNLLERYINNCYKKEYIPSLYEIYEYINMKASNVSFAKGRSFTGGVVISNFSNMKISEFKILYILGLNEGNFPREENKSSLDLCFRFEDRIKSEEKDKYDLYKLICRTKEKVYLTYVSKDLEKDAKLYKCGVLKELIDYIEENIIYGEFAEIEMPMFGNSKSYYTPNEKIKDYCDAFINYNENDMNLAKAEYENKKTCKTMKKKYDKDFQIEQEGDFKLNITDIRDFLMNPIEWTLKFFGLKDKFENEKDYVYEPVSIKDFEYNNIINNSVLNSIELIKDSVNTITQDIFNKEIMNKSDSGIIPQNAIGDNIKNLIEQDYFKIINKYLKIETNILIGENKNYYKKINKTYSAVKINLDNEIPKEENCIFTSGKKNMELSCFIPIVFKNNDIYYFKYDDGKLKYEYEAKLMLLLYILATKNIHAKMHYISKNKELIYELNINTVENDEKNNNKKDNDEKNIKIIEGNLGKLCTDMQRINSLYEYLPLEEYKDGISDKEYINKITKFNNFSSHKHYLIENLPNIFEINNDNIVNRIKKRISLINDLILERSKN